MSTDTFWSYFHELYGTLPRQGPGERASTLRALRQLPPLTASQRLLDIGCGSGAQTLDLAQACPARILAVDSHAPFLAQLDARAAALQLASCVTTQPGDMADLHLPDHAFDVLWSEGAIFIVGFARGLALWRRLIKPGGYLVISESCWLCDQPPAEVRELFGDACADVGDVASRRAAIHAAGYRLLDDFMLPASAWWDNYYVPLGRSVERFRAAHAGNDDALAVAAHSEHEIDVYRRHADSFGYAFFVMQPDYPRT
jgi:SAM-dependent methyltransferase